MDRLCHQSMTTKYAATMSQPALVDCLVQNWLQTSNIVLQVANDKTDCLSDWISALLPTSVLRCLRSSSLNLLTVTHCRTKSGRRRFSVAVPCVWNSLPVGLRTDYDSLSTFNKKAQLMLAYPRDAKTMKKIPPFRSYNKFQSSRKSGVYSN